MFSNICSHYYTLSIAGDSKDVLPSNPIQRDDRDIIGSFTNLFLQFKQTFVAFSFCFINRLFSTILELLVASSLLTFFSRSDWSWRDFRFSLASANASAVTSSGTIQNENTGMTDLSGWLRSLCSLLSSLQQKDGKFAVLIILYKYPKIQTNHFLAYYQATQSLQKTTFSDTGSKLLWK